MCGIGAVCVVFLALQGVQPSMPGEPDPSHGPLLHQVETPAPVADLLRRACYDCHSAETRWPWYARVSPVSWLVASHVRDGREDLDFSHWRGDTRTEPTPAQRLQWICDAVREHSMPPLSYRLIHPEARLSTADTDLLCAWSRQALAALPGTETP